METARRTLVKAIVWNLIGFVMMSLVGLTMTGSVTMSGAIATANTLIGLSCYVIYERVWARVRWGRSHV